MKFEINITKGKFWLLAALIVLAIAFIVFAAEKPNPGHSWDEIGGIIDTYHLKNVNEEIGPSVSCEAGDSLISGGCSCEGEGNAVVRTRPSLDDSKQSWHCLCSKVNDKNTAIAYCTR